MAWTCKCQQLFSKLPFSVISSNTQGVFHVTKRSLLLSSHLRSSLLSGVRSSLRNTSSQLCLSGRPTVSFGWCSTSTIYHRNNSTSSSVLGSSNAGVLATPLDPTLAAHVPLDSTLDLSPGSSFIDSVSTTLVSAEPSLSSLGLGGSTPAGWIQSSLEMLHVGLDVPWWTAIVIGTVCIRLAIFPLVILAQRNSAQMHNHLPTMTRLQQKVTDARRSGDMAEAVKASNELVEFMQRNGVNPLKNLLPAFAQLPIFMSVFTGVRGMAGLPVDSMKYGGLFWFTDLTIPDPFYALPVLSMLTLSAIVEIGADGMKAEDIHQRPLKIFLRAMPFVCFPFIMHFPAAMLCYWLTSNVISLIQVIFLNLPGVRPFFKIPALVNHGPINKLSTTQNNPRQTFMEGFRETMRNAQLAAEMQERQRYNALRLKESTRTKSTSTLRSTSLTDSDSSETKSKDNIKSEDRFR